MVSRRVRILAAPGQILQLLAFRDILDSWFESSIDVPKVNWFRCLSLSLSFRERTIFLSFYVLSFPVYHQSTLLPSSQYYRHYYQLIRWLICPRLWIQAVYLPGIVSFLKLGILHCPKIHLTHPLLGYCLRCYGELISAWLSFVSPSLPLSLSSFSLVCMSSVIIFWLPIHITLNPSSIYLSKAICMKLFERHDLRLWLLESMWAQSIQRIQGALSPCNLMLRFGDMSAKERELLLDSTLSTDREIQFVGALSERLRQLVRCWMLLHIFAVSASPCHFHGKLTKSNPFPHVFCEWFLIFWRFNLDAVRFFVIFRCHSLQDTSDLAFAETPSLSLRWDQQWQVHHPLRSKILFGSALEAF